MIKVDATKQVLVLDLKDQLGKTMADSLISILWLYATSDEQTKAQLVSLSRMFKGEMPLADIDLGELSDDV